MFEPELCRHLIDRWHTQGHAEGTVETVVDRQVQQSVKKGRKRRLGRSGRLEAVACCRAAYFQSNEVPAGARRLMTAGLVDITPDGTLVKDRAEQITQTWKNVRATVEAAGMTCEDTVKMTIYMVDGPSDMLPHSREARAQVLDGVMPGGTLLYISGLADVVWADQVVVALPPRLILERIRVFPEPDPALISIMAGTPTWMVTQAKAVVRYDRAFWRELGLSDHVPKSMIIAVPTVDMPCCSGSWVCRLH